MHGSSDIRKQLLTARLPPLPQILAKLIEYCQEDDVGMDKLAELISKDAAITTKILTTASSTAYRRNNSAKLQLEQALISLGTDLIRTLAISESIFQTFSRFAGSSIADLRRFWKHSLTVAAIARDMAKAIGYPNIDEAYLGGLLHDIGRLAFLAVAPSKYAPTFHLSDSDSLCAAEQSALHITHQEAGAWLIERWKLEPCLTDSVLYHHEPITRIETAHLLVRIIHAAHLLCCHGADDKLTQQSSLLCGLDANALHTISNNAGAKVQQAAEFLGIDLTGIDDAPTETKEPPRVQPEMDNELHDIVLASEAGRTFALQTDKLELCETVMRSACILFNLDDAIVFELDHETQTLIPADERRQRLSRLSLPLSSGGLATEAVLRQRPAFASREQSLIGIAEAQLLRTLNAESLVCVPLVVRRYCTGVLIGGASVLQIHKLEQTPRFLLSFASQAASAMRALNAKQQTAMLQAEQEAEEFRLASRKMAHEINNPLAIIKNYLSLLNDKLMKQEPIGGEIVILDQEIDRVSKILRQFINPVSSGRKQVSDVNAIIDEVVQLFNDTGFTSPKMQIIAQTQKQPPHADCDQDMLTQILINLVKNAIEAMPQGGQLRIANTGHVQRNGKLFLRLTVADTGPGIPTDILENLFHPIRNIKSVEQHRGLGLSIVYDLLNKSNGQIACHSDPNGTTFELLLPSSSGMMPAPESS
ncbi:MAG: histidine kinase [Burkholderiaceae bacterium]|nr:histidine kinase [Burkholderiaceae bacterium]